MYIEVVSRAYLVGPTVDASTTRAQMMGCHILGFCVFLGLTRFVVSNLWAPTSTGLRQ